MDDDSAFPKYEVGYRYRDAGNYRFRGRFVVCGYLDVEALRPADELARRIRETGPGEAWFRGVWALV